MRTGHLMTWTRGKPRETIRTGASFTSYYARRLTCAMLGLLCVATGHVGACWLLNKSPLRRVWYWANAPRINGFEAETG